MRPPTGPDDETTIDDARFVAFVVLMMKKEKSPPARPRAKLAAKVRLISSLRSQVRQIIAANLALAPHRRRPRRNAPDGETPALPGAAATDPPPR